MSLLGLDLNASRVRAVRGPLGDYPGTQSLEPPCEELPLAISLEGRAAIVGTAGLRLCRKSPHLAWQNFLPQLGEALPTKSKWGKARGKLDAVKALTLVLQHAAGACRPTSGMVVALPAYLTRSQVETVFAVADRAGLPILGSIVAPLAAALAAHAEHGWFGTAVVVDVDDQALTIATVGSDHGQAQVLDVRCLPHLSQRVWQERLLNALADCCILESRWDPRESGLAEQSLFDQLDEVLAAAQRARAIKVTVTSPRRYQNLVLQPHDAVAFCTNLRRQAIAEVASIFAAPWPEGAPGAVLVSAAAARLPGLAAALQTGLPQLAASQARKPKATLSALEDFGSGLVEDDHGEAGSVVVLTAGATARGAHSVAAYFQRGDIACGHLATAAPLPLPQPVEAGPARLHFQGHDHLLGTGLFTLGRHAGADLAFDGEDWPGVSARHCEIIYDHRAHMLCDRSRAGTLVNDRPATQAVPLRPGDWIRLGPDGPLLRFLGQSAAMRTTA
jgi:hypothetical protein